MKREDFDSSRPVRLKLLSVSDDGRLMYPGEYNLDEVPDAALACGAVSQSAARGALLEDESDNVLSPLPEETIKPKRPEILS